MDKENNNVARRLGSQFHTKYGNERMRSMSEEASVDEPSTPDSEESVEGFLRSHSTAIATFSAAFLGTIIVSLIISRMWDEDEIKLHVLDASMKLLRSIARQCGRWALECEQAYNEHVNALH